MDRSLKDIKHVFTFEKISNKYKKARQILVNIIIFSSCALKS